MVTHRARPSQPSASQLDRVRDAAVVLGNPLLWKAARDAEGFAAVGRGG